MPHFSVYSPLWDKSVIVFNAPDIEKAKEEASIQFFQPLADLNRDSEWVSCDLEIEYIANDDKIIVVEQRDVF